MLQVLPLENTLHFLTRSQCWFQRFAYCSRRWETAVQFCALPETSVGFEISHCVCAPWCFITGHLKKRLVGLLFIYIITSAQILAVDTHCANHHIQIGKEAGCPSKSVSSKYNPWGSSWSPSREQFGSTHQRKRQGWHGSWLHCKCPS